MNGRIPTLVTFYGSCLARKYVHRCHEQEHDKWQIFPPRSLFTYFFFFCWYFLVRICSTKPHHHQLHATINHNVQTTKLTNNNRRPLLSVFRLWKKNLLNSSLYSHTWHCCGPCLVGDVVFGLDFFTGGAAGVATFSLRIFCWFALFTLLLLTLVLLLLLFVVAVIAFRWLMLLITILLVVVVVALVLFTLTFTVLVPLVLTATRHGRKQNTEEGVREEDKKKHELKNDHSNFYVCTAVDYYSCFQKEQQYHESIYFRFPHFNARYYLWYGQFKYFRC